MIKVKFGTLLSTQNMSKVRKLERIALQCCFEIYAKKMGLFMGNMTSYDDDTDGWICKAEYFRSSPERCLDGMKWVAFRMIPKDWTDGVPILPQWITFARVIDTYNEKNSCYCEDLD